MIDYLNTLNLLNGQDDYFYYDKDMFWSQNSYIQLGVPAKLNLKKGAYDRKRMTKFMKGTTDKLPERIGISDIWDSPFADKECQDIEKWELADKLTSNKGLKQFLFVRGNKLVVLDQDFYISMPVDVNITFTTHSNLAKIISKLAKTKFKIAVEEQMGRISIFSTIVSFKNVDVFSLFEKGLEQMDFMGLEYKEEDEDVKHTDAKKAIKAFGGTKKSPLYRLYKAKDVSKLVFDNGTKCYFKEEK